MKTGQFMHMCIDMENALRCESLTLDSFTDGETGEPVPRAHVVLEFRRRLALGERVYAMGACDNFDPQRGCRGHSTPTPCDAAGGAR